MNLNIMKLYHVETYERVSSKLLGKRYGSSEKVYQQ
jgi:hypothetical protein